MACSYYILVASGLTWLQRLSVPALDAAVNFPRKICFDLCGMRLGTSEQIQRVSYQGAVLMFVGRKCALTLLSDRIKLTLACESIS